MSPGTTSSPANASSAARAAQAHTRAPRRITGPIVAAVGGSAPGQVLPAARHVAAVTGSGVLALSALEPLPLYFPAEAPQMLSPEYEPEVQEARERDLTQQVREQSGERSPWRTKVLVGDAARMITEQARAERASLIIMGVGRHRPVDRLIGGETTLRTIRRAPCPVLAVGAAFAPPFHEVAIATDFSTASAHAAEAVMPLLTDGAVIHLVHVWRPIALDEPNWHVIDEQYEQALPEKFRRFRTILNAPTGVTVKEEIREGKAAERLLDFAAAHHVDLIVAGRHGLNAFERFFVGSTTTALLRATECSLLIAPEPSVPDTDRLQRLLTGAAELRTPASFKAELDDFSRHNRGRIATVEVDDLDFGAQVLETGYSFEGASYDERDRRVELMLAGPDDRLHHVTRSIGGVKWIAIRTDVDGKDLALRIDHGTGDTLLTFTRA